MVSRFDKKNCPKGEHFVNYGADGYCRKNPKSKSKRSRTKSRRRPKVKQRSLSLKSGGEDRDGGFGRGVTIGLAGLGASGLALGGAYLAGKALHGENIRKREQEERESRRPAPEQDEWSENRRRHEMKQRRATEEKVDPDKAEAKKKTVDPDRAEAPPKQQPEKKVGEGDAPPPPKHQQPAVQPPPKKEPDPAVLVEPNEGKGKAIAGQKALPPGQVLEPPREAGKVPPAWKETPEGMTPKPEEKPRRDLTPEEKIEYWSSKEVTDRLNRIFKAEEELDIEKFNPFGIAGLEKYADKEKGEWGWYSDEDLAIESAIYENGKYKPGVNKEKHDRIEDNIDTALYELWPKAANQFKAGKKPAPQVIPEKTEATEPKPEEKPIITITPEPESKPPAVQPDAGEDDRSIRDRFELSPDDPNTPDIVAIAKTREELGADPIDLKYDIRELRDIPINDPAMSREETASVIKEDREWWEEKLAYKETLMDDARAQEHFGLDPADPNTPLLLNMARVGHGSGVQKNDIEEEVRFLAKLAKSPDEEEADIKETVDDYIKLWGDLGKVRNVSAIDDAKKFGLDPDDPADLGLLMDVRAVRSGASTEKEVEDRARFRFNWGGGESPPPPPVLIQSSGLPKPIVEKGQPLSQASALPTTREEKIDAFLAKDPDLSEEEKKKVRDIISSVESGVYNKIESLQKLKSRDGEVKKFRKLTSQDATQETIEEASKLHLNILKETGYDIEDRHVRRPGQPIKKFASLEEARDAIRYQAFESKFKYDTKTGEVVGFRDGSFHGMGEGKYEKTDYQTKKLGFYEVDDNPQRYIDIHCHPQCIPGVTSTGEITPEARGGTFSGVEGDLLVFEGLYHYRMEAVSPGYNHILINPAMAASREELAYLDQEISAKEQEEIIEKKKEGLWDEVNKNMESKSYELNDEIYKQIERLSTEKSNLRAKRYEAEEKRREIVQKRKNEYDKKGSLKRIKELEDEFEEMERVREKQKTRARIYGDKEALEVSARRRAARAFVEGDASGLDAERLTPKALLEFEEYIKDSSWTEKYHRRMIYIAEKMGWEYIREEVPTIRTDATGDRDDELIYPTQSTGGDESFAKMVGADRAMFDELYRRTVAPVIRMVRAILGEEEKRDSTRTDRKCPAGQHFVDYKKGYCRKSPKSSNRRPPRLKSGYDDYSDYGRGRSQANAEAVKVGIGVGAVGLAAAGIAGGYAFAQHATKQAEDESKEREKRYKKEREEEEAWKQERKKRAEAEADREAAAEAEARREQQNRTGETGATAPPKEEKEQTTAKAARTPSKYSIPDPWENNEQKTPPATAIVPPPPAKPYGNPPLPRKVNQKALPPGATITPHSSANLDFAESGRKLSVNSAEAYDYVKLRPELKVVNGDKIDNEAIGKHKQTFDHMVGSLDRLEGELGKIIEGYDAKLGIGEEQNSAEKERGFDDFSNGTPFSVVPRKGFLSMTSKRFMQDPRYANNKNVDVKKSHVVLSKDGLKNLSTKDLQEVSRRLDRESFSGDFKIRTSAKDVRESMDAITIHAFDEAEIEKAERIFAEYFGANGVEAFSRGIDRAGYGQSYNQTLARILTNKDAKVSDYFSEADIRFIKNTQEPFKNPPQNQQPPIAPPPPPPPSPSGGGKETPQELKNRQKKRRTTTILSGNSSQRRRLKPSDFKYDSLFLGQIRTDKKSCPPKHHFVDYGKEGYCRKNPKSKSKRSRTKSRRRAKSPLRAGGKLKSGQDQLSLRGPLVVAGTGLLATAVGVGALAYTGRRGQVNRDPLESPYSPPKVEREFTGKGHKDETEDPEMAERLKNLEKTVEEMSKQPRGGTQVEVNTTVNPPKSGGGQQATEQAPPDGNQQQAQQQATATPPPDGKTTVYPPGSPNEHDSAARQAEELNRQRRAMVNDLANAEQEKKRKKWANDGKNPEAKEMSDELKARAKKKKEKRIRDFHEHHGGTKGDETIAVNSKMPLDTIYKEDGKPKKVGIQPHPDFPREIYSDKEIDARAQEILKDFETNRYPSGDFRMMSNPMILSYRSGTDGEQSHQPMDDQSHFQYYALKRAQALDPETFNSIMRQSGGMINAYVVNPEQETNYADISKTVKKFDELQKFKSRNEQQISHYAPVNPAAKIEPPVGQQARRNVVSDKTYTSGDTTTKIDVDVDNYLAFASSSNKNFEDAKIHVGGMLSAQQQRGDKAARAMKLDDIFEPANENIMKTPTTNRADYNIRSAQLRQVFERATGADILEPDEMDDLADRDPKWFNKIFKFDDDTVNPAKIYHQDVPSARDAAVGATSEQSYNFPDHITIYPDSNNKDDNFIVVNQGMFEREILGNQKNFEKFKASLGDPPENASPEDYYYGLSQDEQNRILKPTKGLALQNSRSKDNFEVDKKGLQLFLQKYHQHALEQADQMLGDDDKSIRLFQYSTPDKEDFRFNRLSLNKREAPHAIKPVSVTNAMNVYSEIKSPDQLAMRNEKGEIIHNLNYLKKYVQDHGYPTSVAQMAFYRKEHNPDFPTHVFGFKKDKDGNEIRNAKGNKVPNSFSSKEGWANYAKWVWNDARQRYGIPTEPTTAERIISVQSAAGEQQQTTAAPPQQEPAATGGGDNPFGSFLTNNKKNFNDWATQEMNKIPRGLSKTEYDKLVREIWEMQDKWIELGGRLDSSLEDRMERAGYDPILLNYINPDYMESLLDGLQKPVRELQRI